MKKLGKEIINLVLWAIGLAETSKEISVDTIDQVTYTQQKFSSHTSGGWKFETNVLVVMFW